MSFRNRFNSLVNYIYLIFQELLFDSYQYQIPLNVPLVCRPRHQPGDYAFLQLMGFYINAFFASY